MAYINVSESNSFVTVHLSTTTIASTATTGNIVVPGLQNITVSNSNGIFRWRQLDTGSEFAIALAATNQLSMSIVLDPTTFFGDSVATAGTAANKGILKLSNDKTLTYFRMYWNATSPGTGSRYISGSAYITGLAPTVSPDTPVWTSPFTLDVVGDFTVATV